MKPISLILLILCILCNAQGTQAIDIIIPDGKDGKNFCDADKGYSAVEAEKSRLQTGGYEVHITIEETNCWITYIIQSSKDGSSSKYNIAKQASGCQEIYAKAGCGGTNIRRDVENMCSEAEASSAAGDALGECVSKEGEACKGYMEKYGTGSCTPGKCVVEALEGSGCRSEYMVVSKGRWTQGSGTWEDIIYYSAITPVCNKGCPAATPASYGCNYTCGDETPETPEEESDGNETPGTTETPKPSGGGKKCSEQEAINAAKGKSGGYIHTTGDGKCWYYIIGDNGTYLYPSSEIGNPDSECCPSYGMAGCTGYCRVKGQDVYNFNSGGEIPSNNQPECSVCDYLKKITEKEPVDIFNKDHIKVGEDGKSEWSKIGEQILNEETQKSIADEIANEFFDTESLETLRDTALKPSTGVQQTIDDLKGEVDIQSDIDFTVENLRVKYEQNVVITEDEKKGYEEEYSEIMIGIFQDTKDYILKSPAFNLFSERKITASGGDCKFQIPSPLGWANNATEFEEMDFCKYKDALADMSIIFRLIAVITAVAIILS